MPNTISQNLQRLQTARTDIATAISDKGVTVPSGSGFEDYATLISSIASGSSVIEGTINPTSKYVTVITTSPLFCYQVDNWVVGYCFITKGDYASARDNIYITGLNLPSTTLMSSPKIAYALASEYHSDISNTVTVVDTGRIDIPGTSGTYTKYGFRNFFFLMVEK